MLLTNHNTIEKGAVWARRKRDFCVFDSELMQGSGERSTGGTSKYVAESDSNAVVIVRRYSLALLPVSPISHYVVSHTGQSTQQPLLTKRVLIGREGTRRG